MEGGIGGWYIQKGTQMSLVGYVGFESTSAESSIGSCSARNQAARARSSGALCMVKGP